MQKVKSTTCMAPFTTPTTGDVVPCGKCVNCKVRRISQWSFRIMQEEKYSDSAYFITLTYDTRHIPITRQGFLSLRYKDVQDFLKRLRKLEQKKLSYYVVGEYGKKRNRPHYHILLFNLQNIENVIKEWYHGEVHFGSVSGNSVGYCLKYMHKDTKGRYYPNDDREPSKGRMSKGIGKRYITERMKNWHKSILTERVYCNNFEQKVSMPRYYRNKIYEESEAQIILEHIRQTKASDPYKRALIEKYPDRWIEVGRHIMAMQSELANFNSSKTEYL